MATPPPAPKQRWYKTLWQAYSVTARADKKLPWIMGAILLVPLGAGIAIGVLSGSVATMIYGPLTGIMIGAVAALYTLTRRFEKQMFSQMDGTLGGSLAVAQSVRRGWQFGDEPVAVDARAKAVVFQGVGEGGIVLLAEGGRAAKRTIDATTTRLPKLAPGVPITPVYVGNGEDEVPLKRLTKVIKATRVKHFGRGLRKGLSAGDQQAVRSRLRALGGPNVPIPKGIDPNRARADRKGLRGR
jgi:hypothetical protein